MTRAESSPSICLLFRTDTLEYKAHRIKMEDGKYFQEIPDTGSMHVIWPKT